MLPAMQPERSPWRPPVRWAAVALLLLTSAPLVPAQEDAADRDGQVLLLRLEDAVRIALDRNVDLEIQEQNTEVAYWNRRGSWGAFDPTFTLGATNTDGEFEAPSALSGANVVKTEEQAINGSLLVPMWTGGQFTLSYDRRNESTNNTFALAESSTTDSVTLALSQPLLRGAWRGYATSEQEKSALRHETEVAASRQTRERVVRDVTNAYWNLVAARAELEVREQALALGEQQLRRDQTLEQYGAGSGADVLQSRTNVATREEQRIRAETDLRAAEDALRTLLFRREAQESWEDYLATWDTPIETLTPLPAIPAAHEESAPDWQGWYARALGNRSELEQNRAAVSIAEVDLRRARSERRPGLDLDLSARGTGFDPSAENAISDAVDFDFPTYTAGLTFSAPIRNRTARNAERAARAQIRLARLQYEKTEMTVLDEVRAAVRDVVYQSEAARAAQSTVNVSEQLLASEEAAFGEGAVSRFQVLEAEQTLFEARSSHVSAQAGYARALVALRHAGGVLTIRESTP